MGRERSRGKSPGARKSGAADVVFTETNGFEETQVLRTTGSGDTSSGDNAGARSPAPPSSSGVPWLQSAASVFLPIGYPRSVTEDYLEYQLWDSAQALCSYLRGTLTTHAVLLGLGVGSADADAAAAAASWIVKDGISLVSNLAFAWWGARRFDSDVKSWRLFADAINDVGLTLQMAVPYCSKDQVLPLLVLSGCCFGACGVAAGATKASLTGHFAREGNMGDVQAKEGTQETAVNLLGMVLGYYLVKVISGSGAGGQHLAWVAFWALMCLHIVCNLRAMRCLRLRTLNRERFRAVMEGWKAVVREGDFDPIGEGTARSKREEENGGNERERKAGRDLMSIKTAAEKERIVLPLFTSFLFTPRIRLGCRLSDVVRALSALDGIHCSFASFAVEHHPLRIRGVGKAGKASSSALLAVLRFVHDTLSLGEQEGLSFFGLERSVSAPAGLHLLAPSVETTTMTRRQGPIFVALRRDKEGAGTGDSGTPPSSMGAAQLCAFAHADILAKSIDSRRERKRNKAPLSVKETFEELLLSFVRMRHELPALLSRLRKEGWDLRRARLGAGAWRFSAQKAKKEE